MQVTQLDLSKRVFSHLGADLRRRSELFLAITAPICFAVLLLSILTATVLANLRPQLADRRTVILALTLRLTIDLLKWVLAFVAFAALAAMAHGRRSLGQCYAEVRDALPSILLLALLTAPVVLGLSVLGTLPLLSARLRTVVASPIFQVGWTWLMLTVFSALLFSVPIRLAQGVGAMDALAESVRTSLGNFSTRAALVFLFAVLPNLVFPVIQQGIAHAIHSPERAAATLRLYFLLSGFLSLMIEFAGLYALCLLYELRASNSRT